MKHQNLSNDQIVGLYNNVALQLGWGFIDSSNDLLQGR